MSMAGTVRPMRDDDLPRVAQLYERVRGRVDAGASRALYERLQRVFIQHPWRDASVPSLVFEGGGGEIAGCLGVVPRPMSYDGRKLLAATSHTFLVAPANRSSMAALMLVRDFLAGPQALALCQGDDISRRIWERAGGAVSPIYSLGWTRPLRPARYALSFLKRRGLPPVAVAMLRPCCNLVDALVPRLAPSAFGLPDPQGAHVDMDVATVASALPKVARRRRLRPSYSPDTLRWMLDTLTVNPARGPLRKAVVIDGGEVVGWYLYYLRDGEIAEVAQLAAADTARDVVLDHLFDHARRDGAVAVSGQVEPGLFQALAGRQCVFHHESDTWVLVHAKDREVLDTINDGRAFLTRMEGEWWISEVLR